MNRSPEAIIIPAAETAPDNIEPIVEARVDATLALEHADEAVELSEATASEQEALAENLRVENQWTSQQLNDLTVRQSSLETMIAEALSPSSLLPLIREQLLVLNLENLEPPTTDQTSPEELTETVAEALAENPEAEMIAVSTTNTPETQTEASSETGTEAPAENQDESVAVIAVRAEGPRLKARLV
jgi:hypothetical protein